MDESTCTSSDHHSSAKHCAAVDGSSPVAHVPAPPLCVFRLVTESGAVLGGRPDLLHHSAGAVPGGHGSLCRGDVRALHGAPGLSAALYCSVVYCFTANSNLREMYQYSLSYNCIDLYGFQEEFLHHFIASVNECA